MTASRNPSTRPDGTLQGGLWIHKTSSCYTPAQIVQYLSRAKFPTPYTEDQISQGAFPATLENLSLLITRHLLTYPFENTGMHYEAEHVVDVSPAGAFNRFVIQGKGAYCYGHNLLFLRILRGLGYRAYGGSGRVKLGSPDAPYYTSHSHILLFVQPFDNSNQTYIADVGFGLLGLARPILLSDAQDNIVNGMDLTERHRLVRETMPGTCLGKDQSSAGSGEYLWSLQLFQELEGVDPQNRNWKTLYTFGEDERFEADYEADSYVIYAKPSSLFMKNLFITRHFLLDDDEAPATEGSERQMYRMMMFGNDVKKHSRGKVVTVRSPTSELERIEALREVFGIEVNDDAVVHMTGRPAAYKL